jgi:hypothetical protein
MVEPPLVMLKVEVVVQVELVRTQFQQPQQVVRVA